MPANPIKSRGCGIGSDHALTIKYIVITVGQKAKNPLIKSAGLFLKNLKIHHIQDHRQQREEPADYQNDQVLFFGMDGDEFPYQRARIVVQRHMTADTDALQSDLAAIAQRPVNMVIAGYKRGVFPSLLGVGPHS